MTQTALTREQVFMMSAGRELDSLVAEKIMGLELVEEMLAAYPRYWLPEYDKTYHRAVPLYSTDISAAWSVVERMRTEYKQFITLIDNAHLNYDVRFSGDKSKEYTRLSNVSHAICRAALLAVLDI
ncbi:hypothetical protein [Paenibacillus sp. 7516]|uniref:BC1872 family protein n=1 Tax=Paenibacillus sp. 7516 TaxID=2022549 RepID=UPI000BA52DE4|nr:hypothetical protein [Paenibacillus sp. 7516]PAF31886.1 hypothetical protein CHI14_09545 [Paenibacillus sp. 7516]